MARYEALRKLGSFCVVSIGVALEHFDMMSVNLYATSMSSYFIPATDANQAVILGFIGYGISFLFRPLGAAFFGIIGDVVGRKPSMILSLILMSTATLGLGAIPSFQSIGWISTALFVFCRIIQGFSVGGEYGTALTYSYEMSGKNRTTAGAAVIGATHVGGLAATLFATQYTSNFQTVFRIAGVIGLLSLGFRSLMVESKPRSKKQVSLKELMSFSYKNKRAYLKSFVIASHLVFVFYSSLIYLNEVIFQKGLASRHDIFLSNNFLMALWIIIPIALAYSVDYFQLNYQRIMQGGALGVALIAWPLLKYADERNSLEVMVFAQILLSVLHMIFCFGTPRFLGDQFSSAIRTTGIALGYSMGASFTAAVTPLICHSLVALLGGLEAIAIPMGALSLLAIVQLTTVTIDSLERTAAL